ncbi:hypothetical protein PJF56_07735 [Roseofilum sp. BLCC_M91]|uniref:Uncharacterized protein n=1 Tax=Roseofilum halophilum BLCC-M91 TaxID=3022259 RepID=A0ABT7BHU9_9CYAN|nr:hypothetical protein [Roseofilum halophilum]MDJ1178749.1 hypothetical protein [Roseofilum halophilum BLCC-M91]
MANQTDTSSNIQGHQVTPEEVSYRKGYLEGQEEERKRSEAKWIQAQKEAGHTASNGASVGIFTGLLIAVISVVLGGSVYYFLRSQEPVSQDTPEVIEALPDVNLPDVQVPDIDIETPDVLNPSQESTDSTSTDSTSTQPTNPESEGQNQESGNTQ